MSKKRRKLNRGPDGVPRTIAAQHRGRHVDRAIIDEAASIPSPSRPLFGVLDLLTNFHELAPEVGRLRGANDAHRPS